MRCPAPSLEVNASQTMKYLALLLFVLSSVLPSQGQLKEPFVRPSLFVSSAQISGPFDIGIRFEIETEWYLYWINPGDAGLAVEIQWDLPEGWTAGAVRFPTPEKMVKGGVTAFGYHEELVLLCRITPDEGNARTTTRIVRAKLDWLVCRESCLAGGAEITLPMDQGTLAGSIVAPERLQQYVDRFPLPLESLGVQMQPLEVFPEGAGKIVSIPVKGEKASGITDFYPEPIEGFSMDFSSIKVLPGQIRMRVIPQSRASVLEIVRGIAILGGKGYSMEASVKR